MTVLILFTIIENKIKTVFLMTKPKFIYFSADQQFIISFIRIKNLIKTLLTLKPKLPISTPKIQEPILSDFKKSRFLYAGVYCIISEEK